MSNLRIASRTLLKHPGPTIVVVLTLAVGIGATAAIYSAIDAVQHFIPIVNRAGLVYATSTDARVMQSASGSRSVVMRLPVSIPDLSDWRTRSTSFEQFAGFALGSANLTGVEVPLRVTMIRITANLGDLRGFRPGGGRGPLSDDEGAVA